MIRILKENNTIENMSNEEIQQLFNEQKNRINSLVKTQIDTIIEKLYKYTDAITNMIIKDEISNYYLDKNDLIIVDDSDDFEDRMEEIKEILSLSNLTDDRIDSDINDIIVKIISKD